MTLLIERGLRHLGPPSFYASYKATRGAACASSLGPTFAARVRSLATAQT